MTHRLAALAAFTSSLLVPAIVSGQYVVENLGRGVVAVRASETTVYVGWRLLGMDPAEIGFNLYRSVNGGTPSKLNAAPITATTNFVDSTADFAQTNVYTVRPIRAGRELAASAPATLRADAPVQQFLTVPLQRPEGGSVDVPAGARTMNYTYSPNDTSVGDLDGDGEYEIVVKWDPSNARDTASPGLSGRPLLDAYRLDGTRLWRIDLGKNIRAGAHYTQFIVYDLNGDGRAEVACKTADGTIDGQGRAIGDVSKDYRSLEVPTDGLQVKDASDRRYGKVLAGPEYFTIFDGQSGAALATTDYIPGREPQDGWGGIGGNGGTDANGNRVDRFLAGVAYLDGRLPSVIMARGYYGRTVLVAWDWRKNLLTSRWVFDSGSSPPPYPNPAASPYSGQGNHSLSVADVDGDGKDEIIYGSMVVDDDGKGVFSTGLRHGDALHAGDLDPERPGLEVFGIHENEEATVALKTPGLALYDARNGRILWSLFPGGDVGRGLAADIDPRHRGAEYLDEHAGRTAGRAWHAHRRRAVSRQLRGLVGCRSAARASRRQLDWQMGLADLGNRQVADRHRRERQQRLQGDSGALCRYPGRLARRGHLARRRQRVAADLHDDNPSSRSPLHADARSAISGRDRLAERRLQPAAAPEFLPGRHDETTAASSHRDAGSGAIGPWLESFFIGP